MQSEVLGARVGARAREGAAADPCPSPSSLLAPLVLLACVCVYVARKPCPRALGPANGRNSERGAARHAKKMESARARVGWRGAAGRTVAHSLLSSLFLLSRDSHTNAAARHRLDRPPRGSAACRAGHRCDVRGCEKESGTGRRFPASQIRERGASARCLSRRAWRSQPPSASPRAPPARLAHALPARPPPPPRCARTPPSLTLPPSLSPPPTTQPPPRRPGRPARLHPGPPCPRRHRRLGRQVPGLRLLPRGSGRGRVPGEDA